MPDAVLVAKDVAVDKTNKNPVLVTFLNCCDKTLDKSNLREKWLILLLILRYTHHGWGVGVAGAWSDWSCWIHNQKQNVINECLFQFISSVIRLSVPSQGLVPPAVGGSFTSINKIKIIPIILRSLFPVTPVDMWDQSSSLSGGVLILFWEKTLSSLTCYYLRSH